MLVTKVLMSMLPATKKNKSDQNCSEKFYHFVEFECLTWFKQCDMIAAVIA